MKPMLSVEMSSPLEDQPKEYLISLIMALEADCMAQHEENIRLNRLVSSGYKRKKGGAS